MKFINGIRHISKKDTAAGFINFRLTFPFHARTGPTEKNGCSYCDDRGAGFDNLSGAVSVGEQLKTNMDYIGRKYKADKFIAYFQNFTNTFLPLSEFKSYMEMAAKENIVEIAVSTRPDCIRNEYLDVLDEIKKDKGIEITEIGRASCRERV